MLFPGGIGQNPVGLAWPVIFQRDWRWGRGRDAGEGEQCGEQEPGRARRPLPGFHPVKVFHVLNELTKPFDDPGPAVGPFLQMLYLRHILQRERSFDRMRLRRMSSSRLVEGLVNFASLRRKSAFSGIGQAFVRRLGARQDVHQCCRLAMVG